MQKNPNQKKNSSKICNLRQGGDLLILLQGILYHIFVEKKTAGKSPKVTASSKCKWNFHVKIFIMTQVRMKRGGWGKFPFLQCELKDSESSQENKEQTERKGPEKVLRTCHSILSLHISYLLISPRDFVR